MARYTGPKARRWRRIGQVPPEGTAVTVTRRLFPPGMHGQGRRSKQSEYAVQLQEKQKAKYTFGILERQFANYYKKADKKTGVTGENLMRALEMRLDNVVYRLGLAESRMQSRQLVTHGHVLVNGQKTSVPSYEIKEGDEITLAEKYRKGLAERLDPDHLTNHNPPDWIQLVPKSLSGRILARPTRQDMDATINEQLIVEYYSR